MKTNKHFGVKALLLIFMMTCWMSCSKEEATPDLPCTTNCDGEIEVGEGISEEELPAYQGDIGIVASVREIQKKGYSPASIELLVNAKSGDFSKRMELNPYTLMGQIKLPVEELSEETRKELREGVEVVVKILDDSGAEIWEETISKISFQSNPLPVSINSNDLEDLNTRISLKSNTPYYIQILEDGVPTAQAVYSMGKAGGTGGGLSFTTWVWDEATFTGGEDEASFLYTFEAIPGTENTYAIKHIKNDRYLRINRNWNFLNVLFRQAVVADLNWTFPDDFINGNTDARFVIKENADGSYHLESVQGERIKLGNDANKFMMINAQQSENLSFRFIPMNIDWSIETIETQYMEPVLPPAKNGFSFNSTLINCGPGGLSQTIGSSKTVETVTTVGWEETISISSSHSAGGSLTIGMEVSARFFDFGASYSAEATADYNYTTTSATETTNWNEAQGSTSETFFSERTITVPSKSASLVYDAFQHYDNIKVNVVQRLRVRASEHDTGELLSGEEIKTQFHFNGFEGVVTEVGLDYIEVTLRGVATLDKIFKSQSDVQEVNPNCE